MLIEFYTTGGTSSVILPGGVAIITPNPILPRDDLRAYAYEGDGSSSGSLSSATSSGRRVVQVVLCNTFS